MIKLENISKYYYSSIAVVPALRKIKLEFAIGEFVAITGESGSGKSTLLNILSGMDTYDDGELYIDGEVTSHFDDGDWEDYRKNRIGFVYQDHNLVEHYSVLNNVESTLLIQGFTNKEAKNKAKELIKRVGLGNKLYSRASKLSSGQKQRLSIARALAKNTDIIVADEPTGNLDSQTGSQIMELFGELAKDKLIIVVTHNYEEAKPYVTRKIRMHDGEVISDQVIKQRTAEMPVTDANTDKPRTKKKKVRPSQKTTETKNRRNTGRTGGTTRSVESDTRIALRFVLMNITTQPRRMLLYLMFLIITASSVFLFLGNIARNWDDTFTRVPSTIFFRNLDNTRIVVKKPDGSSLSHKDMQQLQAIKHVWMVDNYDYANDINYHIDFEKDYIFNYKSTESITESPVTVDFKNWTRFVKSATCITEDDLRLGRLPQNRNEIALYSVDEKVLGTEKACYFTNANLWGYNEYYLTTVKVVGILKEESSQVYFSKELCSMLILDLYDDHYSVSACPDFFTGEYRISKSLVPVIGENLDYGEIRVSREVSGQGESLAGKGELKIFYATDQKQLTSFSTFDALIREDYNEHSSGFMEINETWFHELYRHESNQASVYIKDYVNTDYVLDKLTDMGYSAISAYRISASDYDSYKSMERITAILTSSCIILIIGILVLIILRSLLKLRNNDFDILGSMGMNQRIIKRINYYEMLIYTTAAILVTVSGAGSLSLLGVNYIEDLVKYYSYVTYGIYVVINLFMIMTTVWLYNRYLSRRQKWS